MCKGIPGLQGKALPDHPAGLRRWVHPENGVYQEVTSILENAGKTVVEFSGIQPNPTYGKVLEGAKLAREHNVDMILAVGAAA